MGHMFWQCNLKATDVAKVLPKKSEPFWIHVEEAWFTVCANNVKKSSIIWYNSEILVDNAPIFWKEAHGKGLCFIKQLFKNGVLKSIVELAREYGLTWFESNTLVAGIPKHLKQMHSVVQQYIPTDIPVLSSRAFFKETEEKTQVLQNKCLLWEKELGIQI